MYLSRRFEHSSSNLALVRVVSICLGSSAVAVIKRQAKGTYKKLERSKQKKTRFKDVNAEKKKNLMFVWVKDDSSIFAFSVASVSHCRACLSFSKSTLIILEVSSEPIDNSLKAYMAL